MKGRSLDIFDSTEPKAPQQHQWQHWTEWRRAPVGVQQQRSLVELRPEYVRGFIRSVVVVDDGGGGS